jgi:hypothetical protein
MVVEDPDKQFAAEQYHRRWERGIGAITTIAAAVAAYFAWGAWHASQGQLKAMQDEQRPWLKPTLAITDGLQGGSIPVTAQVENVGHAPALDAVTYVWTRFAPDSPFFGTKISWSCSDIRNGEAAVSKANAGVVFPGDKVNLTVAPNRVALNMNMIFRGQGEAPFATLQLPIQLNICVDYKSQEPAGHHSSAQVFQLMQNGNQKIPIHDTVPKDQLQLLLVDAGAN